MRRLERKGLFAAPPTHTAALAHDSASHWALERQPHTRTLGFETPAAEPLLWVAGRAPLNHAAPANKGGLYLLHHYEGLARRRMGVNILDAERACELVGGRPRYGLVCFPQLHVITDAAARCIRAYVAAGGIAIFGPRTGHKTQHNNLHDDAPQPGRMLTELLGITVEEFDTSEEGITQAVLFQGEGEDEEVTTRETERGDPSTLVVTAGVWYEKLQVVANTARVWARYGKRRHESPPAARWYNPELNKSGSVTKEDAKTINRGQDSSRFTIDHFYENSPAVVANTYGLGQTIYIGCMGKDVFENVLDRVVTRVKDGGQPGPPTGVAVDDDEVEVCRRGKFYFLMNHSNDVKVCEGLPLGLVDALANDAADQLLDPSMNGRVPLQPFSYRVGCNNGETST